MALECQTKWQPSSTIGLKSWPCFFKRTLDDNNFGKILGFNLKWEVKKGLFKVEIIM
jgi:hypothetical protein